MPGLNLNLSRLLDPVLDRVRDALNYHHPVSANDYARALGLRGESTSDAAMGSFQVSFENGHLMFSNLMRDEKGLPTLTSAQLEGVDVPGEVVRTAYAQRLGAFVSVQNDGNGLATFRFERGEISAAVPSGAVQSSPAQGRSMNDDLWIP